ncbi:MAG: hypothetical protein ACRDVL_08455 [Acidimicrobiia bacterium]
MVHALRHTHQTLAPNGILLDLHPEPVNSRIEVWQGDRIHELGEVDQHEDHREIEAARSRLDSLVDEGLFSPEETDYFEATEHHDSVASWQEKWAKEGYGLVAPPGMLASAARFLSSGGGELVIKEQVRATRYRRLTT